MILPVPQEFNHHRGALLFPIPGWFDLNWLSMREKPKRGLRRRTDEGGHFQRSGSIHFFWKLDCHGKLEWSMTLGIWYRGNIQIDDFELRFRPGHTRWLFLCQALSRRKPNQEPIQTEQPKRQSLTSLLV